MKNYDIAIIGAGALGIGSAYHLSKLGYSVVVFDEEQTIAQRASGKNAGMFRHLYKDQALTNWAKASLENLPQRVKEVAFTQGGSIIGGRVPPSHNKDLFQQTSITLENGEELSCVKTTNDGLIDPGDFCYHLYSEINKSACKFLFNTSVKISNTAYPKESSLITKDGESFSAKYIIVASGYESKSFLWDNFGKRIEMFPYARHLFVINGWQSSSSEVMKTNFFWDEKNHWYMRKWGDNKSRIVSICDQQKADPCNYCSNDDILEKLGKKLEAVFPKQYQNLSLQRSWHCFRTYTEDQLPIWGEEDEIPGVFWLLAFGGFGMSTSFGATLEASVYIDAILNNKNIENPYPKFSLNRVLKKCK